MESHARDQLREQRGVAGEIAGIQCAYAVERHLCCSASRSCVCSESGKLSRAPLSGEPRRQAKKNRPEFLPQIVRIHIWNPSPDGRQGGAHLAKKMNPLAPSKWAVVASKIWMLIPA